MSVWVLFASLVVPAQASDDGGPERVAVAAGGAAAFGLGVAWYFGLGDTYGAGDPASQLIGGGLVALGGTALGAAAAAGGFTGGDGPAGGVRTPPLALGLGYGGGAWQGETAAHGTSLSLAPRLALSRSVQVRMSASAFTSLGASVDLDPRPQTTDVTALSRSERGLDVGPELQWVVSDRVQLGLRAMLWTRIEDLQYDGGSTTHLQRNAMLPAVGGVWFSLTEGQRIGLYSGPRFDRLVVDGEVLQPWFAPWYGEAWYEVQLQHGRLLGGDAASRVRLSYRHTNFDGAGFNTGAMIGFAGPFHLDWDLQRSGAPERWGWQVGVDADLADGGGVGMAFGLVPPHRRSR